MDSQKLIQKIKNKLNGGKGIKSNDNKLRLNNTSLSNMNTITVNDVIDLIGNNKLCPDCNCELLFYDYQPFCLYQFSIDRIDNKLPHTISNCRITCYDCNAMKNEYVFKRTPKKSCIKGCHTCNDEIEKSILDMASETVNPFKNIEGPVKYKNNNKKTILANKIINNVELDIDDPDGFNGDVNLIIQIMTDLSNLNDFNIPLP